MSHNQFTFVPSLSLLPRVHHHVSTALSRNRLWKTSLLSHRQIFHMNITTPPKSENASSTPKQNVLDIKFENEEDRKFLQPNSGIADFPILVYISGLDAEPLPSCQVRDIKINYIVVSICHHPNDRSEWEELVQTALPVLSVLRANSSSGLTIVGESFGAAFALRLVAACKPDVVSRLFLINSGTALCHDNLLNAATSLLPVLKIDRSERVLYKAAAIFLFKLLLTEEHRLASDSLPKDDFSFLKSVDIDAVPLDAMLHRVALLKSFSKTFTDRCIRDLVQVPTVLIVSGKDRLLNSRREGKRLSTLLPNVENTVVLEQSAHAALLERDVSLASLLAENDRSERVSAKQNNFGVQDEQYVKAVKLGKLIFGPWRRLTSPLILGSEHVQEALNKSTEGANRRPVLFVGNHGVFGMLDLPILFILLTEMLGSGGRLRSLADVIHFEQFAAITDGKWSRFVSDLGAMPATARNYYRLLSAGENILLFPAGAREVCRRRGEEYRFFWQTDVDFVRPAAKFNALIVPFSAVGADDAVDILIDGQELQRLPVIGRAIQDLLEEKKLSKDNVMPITSFPPRTDRFYFKFHKPIDTMEVDHSDPVFCKFVYDECRFSVEGGVQELLEMREKDPRRRLDTRILKELRSGDGGAKGVLNFVMGTMESMLPIFEP